MTKRRRQVLIAVVLVVAAGILGPIIGYQWYYRSDRYRHKVERALTDFFGLPTDVGGVRPHGLTARELMNLEMWLPERRARIFWCPRAIWDAAGEEGTVLHLYQPVLAIGSEEWKADDYMRVLKASLLHNFSDLNIRRVQFHDARITWPRRNLEIRVDGVDGTVDFKGNGRGEAELTARSLNEHQAVQPIRIHALIDPANTEDFLPEVSLTVPPLPLAALGLDQVLGSPVTQGSFSGTIALRQMSGDDMVDLTGVAENIRLAEFTQRIQGGPLSGLVELTIHHATIRGHQLESLRFNGKVRDLNVDPLLRRFGLPEIGGKVKLEALNGRVQGDSILGMDISGEWEGGSLGPLSKALLETTSIQGQVTVTIHSLIVKKDELVSGNIDVKADPPPGKPSTISKSVLLDLLSRYLGFAMPDMLARMMPESVEFVRARAKLLVDHQSLQILPLPGAGDDAMLTVRVAGQDVPLVRGIDHTFDLTPLIEQARKKAEDLKQTLKQRRPTATATSRAP